MSSYILQQKKCKFNMGFEPSTTKCALSHHTLFSFNSLSAKSVLAGEKLVATYSIST